MVRVKSTENAGFGDVCLEASKVIFGHGLTVDYLFHFAFTFK
jgi:hypothetical protein